MDINLDESLQQVSQVFPDVDVHIIRRDLKLTQSAEQTINRILDGTVHDSSPEKSSGAWTCSSTDVNSDSDLDLPRLKQTATSLKTKLSLSPKSSDNTPDPVIDLSQDEDLSDTDVNSDDDPHLPDLNPVTTKSNQEDQIDLTQDDIQTTDTETIVVLDWHARHTNNVNLKRVAQKTAHIGMTENEQNRRPNVSEDSEDSDTSISLANRLGLAERCGYKFKAGVSSSLSSTVSKQSNLDEDADQTAARGIKRKVNMNILLESGQTAGYSAMLSEDGPAKKTKKKRTAEEIAESKRQAEKRRVEKQQAQEEKKAQKQKEVEMRKAIQENKRHFRAGDCVKYLTVSVDPGVINSGQLGTGIFKVCGDLGARCVTETQLVPNTITWKREVLDCHQETPVKREIIEDDVLAMIPTPDFVSMVHNYFQGQQGLRQPGSLTVKEFIQTLQGVYPGKTVAVFVMGKEKYFSDQKLANKRNHREAVLGTRGTEGQKQKKSKKGSVNTVISRVQMEEAMIDAQLHTSCIVQFAETSQDASDLVKCFTKAVADKPAKKDRLENVFDFLAEGAAGVKVDKTGTGLLKVWKHQLLQFKNVGPDMAEAIISAYPSPRLLYEAYQNCTTEKEGQKLLENIVVRRGAGVLVTNRRIGKELSRRIYSLFQSTDSNFIIK